MITISILELHKVMDNWDKLDDSDIVALSKFGLGYRLADRDVNFDLFNFLELMSLLKYLIDKHNLSEYNYNIADGK